MMNVRSRAFASSPKLCDLVAKGTILLQHTPGSSMKLIIIAS